MLLSFQNTLIWKLVTIAALGVDTLWKLWKFWASMIDRSGLHTKLMSIQLH